MKVFKYPTLVNDHQTILMPKGARILTVQVQRGVPCIWALVHPGPMEHREFRLVGTGHEIPDSELCKNGLKYIGSYQLEDGELVFHLFEVTQ